MGHRELSTSSVSSGEFLPPAARHTASREPLSSLEHRDSTVEQLRGLESLTRQQLLQLLSRQQDDIARRERELSNINSGI